MLTSTLYYYGSTATKDLHLEHFKLDSAIKEYPSSQVPLLAKDSASYYDDDDLDHDRDGGGGGGGDGGDGDGGDGDGGDLGGGDGGDNDVKASHPDHANGEKVVTLSLEFRV